MVCVCVSLWRLMGWNMSFCWWATQQHIVTKVVLWESVPVMSQIGSSFFFWRNMDEQHSYWNDLFLLSLSFCPHPPSSYLFMTFSIFSTLPLLPPLLMHLFLSFSLSPWLCNLLFLLSPNEIKASPPFLFFCLFVDVLSISESRRVCAAEAVQNRNRESLCVCVTDVRYQ